ncbi:MAG: hypothetical protein KBT63_02910 [Porticoccaceae bacterium]|nr:hypothetical protein [Porticoccaceae bacterium]
MKTIYACITAIIFFGISSFAIAEFETKPPPAAYMKKKMPSKTVETYDSRGNIVNSTTTYEYRSTKPKFKKHPAFVDPVPIPGKMIKKIPISETQTTNSKGETTKIIEYEYK